MPLDCMLLTMCIVVSVPAEFAWYAPNPLRLGSIEPEHIRSSKCAFRPRSASRLLLRTVYSNFATMAPPPIELNVYNPDTHILNIINVKQASVESIQSETKKRDLSTDGGQFFLVPHGLLAPQSLDPDSIRSLLLGHKQSELSPLKIMTLLDWLSDIDEYPYDIHIIVRTRVFPVVKCFDMATSRYVTKVNVPRQDMVKQVLPDEMEDRDIYVAVLRGYR
ncbi:hypothetical protein C8Q72DRAFT_577011 [Fomitopsis betulina]|nr:hypothetical protein C8Q72DRAFT_577011 [Fomitopsis betulina]